MGEALSQDLWYPIAAVQTIGDWTLLCRRKRNSQGTNDRFRPREGVPCSHIKAFVIVPNSRRLHPMHKTFGVKPENRADKARSLSRDLLFIVTSVPWAVARLAAAASGNCHYCSK